MAESMFKKVFLHFCILSFLIMVVKTSPIKKFKRIDLESCLNPIKGQMVFPDNPQYFQDITDENTRVTFHPIVIVYVANVNDVQIAIQCAKSLNLTISARSGGHSYETYSTFGNMAVDVSKLNNINVEKEINTAIIGSGNKLGQIYYNLSQNGFLIPAGSCPSVGVGGHALGGGFGLYSRKYSIASDNILSIDMVTVNGTLITANATENEDLFFALRGAGGNNFGIVTSFTFKLNPTPPTVTSITFIYDIDEVQTLFDTINELGQTLTDDITFLVNLNATYLQLNGVYLGTEENAQIVMKNFTSLSKPNSTYYYEETFFSSVVRWSGVTEEGVINPVLQPYSFKVKSFFVKLPGLSHEGIQSLRNFISTAPSDCPTQAIFDLYGGAVNSVAANETAFVHRDILYGIQLLMELNGDLSTTEECVDLINNFGVYYQKSFTDYSSYQNYIDRDLDDWQTRYYGSNFPKLVATKGKFDPDNLLNFPQAI